MLRTFKSLLLQGTRATGVNRSLSASEWRRKKLLILCYHGISQKDEHQWNPELFMSPQTFRRRLEILQQRRYNVLSLSSAWKQLQDGSLPPRSVVLTFDDGAANFYLVAFPILRKSGYPATVYLRTDHCDSRRRPVFAPVCPYLLWKQRDRVVPANPDLGWSEPQDLRTASGRSQAWSGMQRMVRERRLSDDQRNALLVALTKHIGINYDEFVAGRILQIMLPEEVTAISREGVEVQLHTHAHRELTEMQDEDELRSEIQENRKRILQLTGKNPVHFCYPSGRYTVDSPSQLRRLDIVTATTCEPDLVTVKSDPLLLPRYIDTELQTEASFEAWLSGVGSLLASSRHRN